MNNLDYLRIFLLYSVIVVLGVFLEVAVHKLHYFVTKTHYKEHHFTLGKYVFFLFFPILGLLIVYSKIGLTILQVLIIFSIVGTVLEWLVGFTYHQMVGVRLWTYHRYAITKYTSFLSIPLWGFFGIILWLLAKSL